MKNIIRLLCAALFFFAFTTCYSAPILTNQTDSFSFAFDMPANSPLSTSLDIPTFDNSRGTINNVILDLTFASRVNGHESNSSFVGVGTTIATINPNFSIGNASGIPAISSNYSLPLTCVTPGGCYPFSVFVTFPLGDFRSTTNIYNPGPISMLGGAVPLKSNSTVTNGSGSYSGTVSYSVSGSVTYQYDAKTSQAYANDASETALKSCRCDPATSPVDFTRQFYVAAIKEREQEGTTGPSIYNQNIKDVEYYGRNLNGGYLAKNPSLIGSGDALNDFFDAIGPASTPTYDALKTLLAPFLPPASSINYGEDVKNATSGWLDGAFGTESPQELIRDHFSDSGIDRAPPPASGATVPFFSSDLSLPDGLHLLSDLFVAPVSSGIPLTLDPKSAPRVLFAVGGDTFDTISFSTLGRPLHSLELFVNGAEFRIATGSSFDFGAHGLKDVNAFLIEGLDQNGVDNFDLVSTFATDGTAFVTVIDVPAAVDEPPMQSLWISASGLIMFLAKRSRRMKESHASEPEARVSRAPPSSDKADAVAVWG
jgi:hypothetical protein